MCFCRFLFGPAVCTPVSRLLSLEECRHTSCYSQRQGKYVDVGAWKIILSYFITCLHVCFCVTSLYPLLPHLTPLRQAFLWAKHNIQTGGGRSSFRVIDGLAVGVISLYRATIKGSEALSLGYNLLATIP